MRGSFPHPVENGVGFRSNCENAGFGAGYLLGSLREGAVERSETEGVTGSLNKQRDKLYSCFVS